MNLEHFSGYEIGEIVNNGDLSPVEVIEYFAHRIQALDSYINSFTYTKFDEAKEEAKILEKRIMQGEYVGPFAGVPVALKDFLPSKKGWTNSHGGVKHLIQTDEYDSMFYTAAKKLGAIAIGKTNAPAFGFSGSCSNALYGTTSNPFDIGRTSGGSSGGTAAAVAAGFISFGEGGDAGGSIRIPAGWCNLFGFKPSLGTVPSYCRPDGWAATHPYCFNGVLSKSVTDSVLMLNEMAQYNPRDPISLPINSNKNFLTLMNKPIEGMKIGFTYDFDLYNVDAGVCDKLFESAKLLEAAGAVVDKIHFDFKHTLQEILHCWAWAISVDTALDLQLWKDSGLDLVKDYRHELTEEFIKYNEIAEKATIKDMRKFNEIRTDILDNFENIFEEYDAIISPTAVCPPFMHSDGENNTIEVNGTLLDSELSFISFGETPILNFIGYPAASVPMGLIDDRLPVGMQVMGKQYKDEDVLAICKTFETIRPWKADYSLSMKEC